MEPPASAPAASAAPAPAPLDPSGHVWAHTHAAPGWDAPAPLSVVIFSAAPDTHADPASWSWSADGRLWFAGGQPGGPYGFLVRPA